MVQDFEIRELVFQDAEGVIFRARNLQNQQLICLHRFFLEPDAITQLQVEGENGVSLFVKGLAKLQILEAPGVRRILTGGFDEVDKIPYIVTEWVEGESIESCLESKSLVAGDGAIFETQVERTFESLPEEVRKAVKLTKSEVILTRSKEGEIAPVFSISPAKYFGALGGMTFSENDFTSELKALQSCFPKGKAPEVKAKPIEFGSPRPVELASAKRGSGKGMLIGLFAALVLFGAAVAWFFIENAKSVEKASPRVVVYELAEPSTPPQPEVELQPVVSAAEPLLDEGSELQIEEVEGLPPAQEPSVIVMPAVVEEVVAEEKEEEVAPVPEPEVVPEPEPDLEIEDLVLQSAETVLNDSLLGESLILEGVVESLRQTQTKKTWFLNLSNGTEMPTEVVYFRSRDPEERDYSVWENYENKTVKLEGKVGSYRGKLQVRLFGWDAVKITGDANVYPITEAAAVRARTPGEVVVTLEGELTGFSKSKEAGYLVFAEAPEVRACFLMDSELGQDLSFRRGLAPMKGQKVLVRGRLTEDSDVAAGTLILLEYPASVELVEE